jgi:hypothetical protein
MTRMMRDFVQVQGNFKPSVQLPNDFLDEELNRHFVESYIPTQETLEIFLSIRESLQPHSDRRTRLFSSTFGTGKSDLMLMIANYVTRSSEDLLLAPFFEKLRHLNDAKAEAIYQARQGKPPFLLVLLQADTAITFSSFVLDGLVRSLEQAKLNDLLGKTYYKAALDLIETWERDRPDNIERLSEVLETNYGRTLNQLRRDLSGPHGDSALEVFRPAILDAIGMPFHPTAVIQRPADAFSDVTKLLDSGQYSGIFVIIDEFSHLLQKLADSPTAADSKAIDNLAEVATRSGHHQLHFYTVSLQSFASAQGSTKASQIALERSGGRFFVTHELRSQNAEELISASIVKRVPISNLFQGIQAQLDDLLNLATKLWSGRATGRRDREWLNETVVRGCFPLHPLTTYCLPRLNAALAQNERTMFSFIWDRGRGLGHFIEEATGEVGPNGWLPLLSLDMLFAYFEPNIKEKRPDLLLAYQQASSTLSATQLGEGLEGRLLRALVMLEVAGGDPNLGADHELLRHALGLAPSQQSDVTTALQQLEQDGIAYPLQSRYYQLVKSGRANPLELRRLVQQQAQELPGSSIELLNANYKQNNVEAERYNSERGTSRQLAARFTNLAELSSPAALMQALQDQDGLVWYVIAASEQELDQARSTALQLTRQYDQLVVAVPQKPIDLVIRFQRVRALEKLRADPNFMSSDYQALLAHTGLVGRDCITAFQEALRLFDQPSKFEWFYGGQNLTVTTSAHLSTLATAIMNEVFSSAPIHKTRQHLKTTGKSKYLRDALNQILQDEILLVERKKSPVDAILMDGAYELGLIYFVDLRKPFKVYNVCAPEPQQRYSHAVWIRIYKQLQNGVAWPEIVEELLKRPYGLYPSVLELFLAAFYRYNRDYLEVYSMSGINSQPIDVTGDTIIDMVESPNRYILRYQPLTESQCKLLRGMVERALYPGREFEIQRGETASLRNRAARLLRRWMNGISSIPHQTSPDELASVLRDVPQDILSLCVMLIEIAFKPEQAMTAADLVDRLPTQVGLYKDSSSWTDVELDQALAYLETACHQLRGFHRAFEADMTWQIGQLFGLTELPTNSNDILALALRWRKGAVSAVQTQSLAGTPDARDLLQFLDDRPHSFEQVFLNALPSRWVKLPFREWRSISTRDEYLLRLERAKAAVEAKAAGLGVLAPPREAIELGSSQRQDLQFSPSRAGLNPASQPETKSAAAVKTNAAPIGPRTVHEAQPIEKVPDAVKQSVSEQAPQQTASITLDSAFATIRSIFDSLSPRDQRQLWEYLAQEYDPR